MKNERGILLGWYAGFGLGAIAIALLVFESQMSACEKKQAPPTDDIRITRTTEGDVTIVVQGPTTYVGFHFYPWGSPEYAKKRGLSHIFVVEWVALGGEDHRVQHLIGNARSVKLQNVTCQIKKRETRRFEHRFGIAYALVCGPDAVPGEKLSVKGTFTWNSTDGVEHFFHEDGTGRVWKTVPQPENKEKKEEKK